MKAATIVQQAIPAVQQQRVLGELGRVGTTGLPDGVGEIGGEPGFATQIRHAMESLVETGREADAAVMAVATGGEGSIHGSMIRLQEADLQLRFVVQLRNRAISAYEEVMRLQV